MNLNHLHFAHPAWLWAAIAIPLAWIAFLFFYRAQNPLHQLEKFIDSHLLPHLLLNNPHKKSSLWKTLLVWSIVWACLTLALAGPRWNLREMETFSQDQSLVLLLDLSDSMNTADIKPSRLVRAKQKIEDLLNLSKGVKIGLIAFAADAHMITPITEDKETIRHLLPSLETDLIHVQGSKLSSALDMASTMLTAEPGHNKAILVISDGGFEDAGAILKAKKLAEKGLVIHVMGMGTEEGAFLNAKTHPSKKSKAPIFSKLEKERLREISQVGNGRYLQAHYSDHEEAVILKELGRQAEAQMQIGKKKQFWDEGFYLMILPALPIMLWWFRRGSVFAIILSFILFTPLIEVEATPFQEYFKNSEELGKQAWDAGDYTAASETFQDPYRKGVAYYRANNFAEAEKMFRQSARRDVASHAAYNLGNSLVQQQKLKEAIAAYEDVLAQWPDHAKAEQNLELVKKMLEQQPPDGADSENADSGGDQSENGSEKENKEGKAGSEDSSSREKSEKSQANKGERGDEDVKEQANRAAEEKKGSQKEERENSRGSKASSKDTVQDSAKDSPNESSDEAQAAQTEQGETASAEGTQKEAREVQATKSQKDQDADLWLDRISNDPKMFLKNKFYIESKRNGTKEGIDPW